MYKDIKIIVIDPYLKTVEYSTIQKVGDMRKIVGGNLEKAIMFNKGNDLYVNEDAWFNNNKPKFKYNLSNQVYIFSGKAFIIGRRKNCCMIDTTMNIENVNNSVKFQEGL